MSKNSRPPVTPSSHPRLYVLSLHSLKVTDLHIGFGINGDGVPVIWIIGFRDQR